MTLLPPAPNSTPACLSNFSPNLAPAASHRFAICGAGPVGMACAAFLVQGGVPPAAIALIDGKTVAEARRDPRSIALSYGSRLLLEQLGAWPIEASPIHQIHVSRAGRFGRTVIDRAEQGVEALGYVAQYGAIVGALADACERAGVENRRPLQVHDCTEQNEAVVLSLGAAGGKHETIRAALAIQAEGGVFKQQTARRIQRDYGQTAIIAHITANAPQQHRAYERFTDQGPLALLPQQDADTAAGYSRYALVWCVRPQRAQDLLALGDAAFLQQLQQAFGNRLGRLVGCTPRAAFALGLNANQPCTARTVAIGNAAQTLHPVGGQGLNLGLRDAYVLARLLAQDGHPATLEKFDAARAADRGLTMRLTDSLARLFTRDSGPGPAPLQAMLGLSLGLLDAAPLGKRTLAEWMMYGRRIDSLAPPQAT